MAANITFDGAALHGGGLKVHGGWWQRGGKPAADELLPWGKAEGDGSGLRGRDCFLKGDAAAAFKCKPSWRLRFGKRHPFNAAFGALFRFPAGKQRCNDPRALVLRSEWTDSATRTKNKLTLDMVKAAGGLAARVEYARLLVNGDYFGLYAVEEHLGAHRPARSLEAIRAALMVL